MRALILIADAGRARLFVSEGRTTPWTLLEQLEHPEVRSARDTLATDQPGRTQERMATGRRASMEPPTPLKRVEAEKFAAVLADRLERAAIGEEFERLVIVAPPRFLGSLRESLSESLMKRQQVVSIDKDLSTVPDVELPARISSELRDRDLPAH